MVAHAGGSAFQPVKSNKQAYCVACLAGADLKTLPCIQCGTEFKQKQTRQVYCSKRCQDRYLRAKGKDEIAECRLCGAPFAFKPGHDKQGVFCSRECVGLHTRLVSRAEAKMAWQLPDPRDQVVRLCRMCKEPLAATVASWRRYCDECRVIRGRQSGGGRTAPCIVCGAM